MPTIQAGALRSFANDILTAGGFSPADAAQTAELLVWANLRGVDSHGVLRIPRYIEMIELGLMRSGGSITTVREFGAVTVLDGGKCPGAVGMNEAVERAARSADKFGIGWCAARAISHAGAIGYFTTALAERGLVGIAMTASKPLMSYFGAKGEALSTNPLSIAFPVADGKDPIVLDMSTASVALGKIMAAKDAGRSIPEGWAIDADGNPATDPNTVAALLPMAGAKGSGLSLMIEMLASVLAGNAVIGPVLTGIKKGGFNGLVMAINPVAFGEQDTFGDEVARLADAIHRLEPVAGNDAVLLPGERGATTARMRSSDGIPLPAGTVTRLCAFASKLGVSIPDGLE
ncbi:Ldh family oxidoreductase [Thalassospira lucentensis]|uniref:Ldh family oxidoreductase n=1 Tax=Thalassospira lucentensis TaxID=168935 RepID=UPI0003B3D8F9|nr:Ldh family oxidoreductase [Thalassospira lucentensis]RCK21742.1 dehydrogenase [Thalassospira lucentensis MCCC 1A00383 = DSM 14000]